MELFILRFVACVEILAAIALGTAVSYLGIVEVQRRIARWLLLDARAWAAREAAKSSNRAEVAEVV